MPLRCLTGESGHEPLFPRCSRSPSHRSGQQHCPANAEERDAVSVVRLCDNRRPPGSWGGAFHRLMRTPPH